MEEAASGIDCQETKLDKALEEITRWGQTTPQMLHVDCYWIFW